MGNHLRPGFLVVVGAVDARDAHAARHQVVHNVRVPRGLRGQGHHDAGVAVVRLRPQGYFAVVVQYRLALGEVLKGGIGHGVLVVEGDAGAGGHHRINGGHDPRFQAAQGRQPQGDQLPLQFPDVMPPQGHVVRQVLGARAEVRPLNVLFPTGIQEVTIIDDLLAQQVQFLQQRPGLFFSHGISSLGILITSSYHILWRSLSPKADFTSAPTREKTSCH